jgi:hypothetical protein
MRSYQGGILVTQLWSRKTLHTLWWCKWRSPYMPKINMPAEANVLLFEMPMLILLKKI